MKRENDTSNKRGVIRIGVLLLSVLVLAVGIGVSAKYVKEKELFHGRITVPDATANPGKLEGQQMNGDLNSQLPIDPTEAPEPSQTDEPAEPVETEPAETGPSINDPSIPTQQPDSES